MSRASSQRVPVDEPRRLGPAYAPGSRPGVRRRRLALPVAMLIVVVAAAAAGAGTWYALRQAPAARGPAVLHSSTPTGPTSAPPAGLASLAPAAALYPGASAIESVVNRYFQAINGRDYSAYQATQSPGIAMTAPQFQAGFASTQDSDVHITAITTMPGGQPAADLTFTSRQQPQDGPEGESCTNWHVTMYFDGSAGTYTIGAPPNGYKAAYQACSA